MIAKLLQKYRFQILATLIVVLPASLVWAQEPLPNNNSVFGNPDDGIIKRIPKLEMYPCSDCHSNPEDYHPNPRVLKEEHGDMKSHFARTEDDGWCLRCHKAGNYLKLTLQSGREISFNDAYLLCSECHSTTYEDWKHNEHGKRTGSWKGPRQVYSCTACHQAHDPKYKHVKAIPGPQKPVNTLWGL
ncbi:MAG: putative cytochrome with 4 heme binding site [uncultured bacterium]|nr:MAG: putative cytochrome with 4 heme binding site [uncultured bacterium]